MERMFVADQVYDRFRDAFVQRTRAMALRPGIEWGSDMGSLISQDQLDTVTAHVEDAVAKGATVLAGGRPRPDIGPYVYEPTVLADVTDEMTLCLGETFGPVVSLYRVADDEEAIALANRGKQGLSASIFSRDIAAAEQLAPRIRAGSVNINDGASLAAGTVEAGMGGMGESGQGRRHGGEGIRRFTESQTVVASKVGPVGPPPGTPAEKFVGLVNKQLKVLRKLGMR
jgi:succinate-semialdehyde dehydrogenase/glutarate-semialdehyde dehydrogenase